MSRFYQCAKILEEEENEWSKMPQSERDIVMSALGSLQRWEEFMQLPTPVPSSGPDTTSQCLPPISSECLAVRNKEVAYSDILNFRVRSILSNQIVSWSLLGMHWSSFLCGSSLLV